MTPGSQPPLSETDRVRAQQARSLAYLGADGLGQLAEMLTDPSWAVRRVVVASLAQIGSAAVPLLLTLLRESRDDEARISALIDTLSAIREPIEQDLIALADDPNPAVVADSAIILGRRVSPGSVPALVRLVNHPNENVVVAAIEALGRIGGRAAVDSLIAAVRSRSFFRVFPAIDVLGRSGDPRAVGPLAELLANPGYTHEAARALGRTGDRLAVAPLAQLCKVGSESSVRLGALALAELQDRFAEKAGSAGPIEEALKRELNQPAVRRLTHVLAGADVNEAVAICRLLGIIAHEEAVDTLTGLLEAPKPLADAAAEALRRIGKSSDLQLVEALRVGNSARRLILLPAIARAWAAEDVAICLDDPDPEVRAAACDTLARLGNPKVIPALFSRLEDPQVRVVHAAIGAIQALGSREAHHLAAKAARSPIASVRRAALRILGYFGHSAGLEPMLEALKDPDPQVRNVALQGLPYLDDKMALEAILEATKDPSEKTRASALRALAHSSSRDPRVAASLLRALEDPDPWARYYACQSLGRLRISAAASRLARLTSDPATQVQVAALEALSQLQGDEAHQALRAAASSQDSDVRRAALIGLGMALRSSDLPLLMAAAERGDVATRLVALSALSGFASPAVLIKLSSAAADSEDQISTAAIGFLAARREPEATEILVSLLSKEESRTRVMAALVVPAPGRVAGLMSGLEHADDEQAPRFTAVLARINTPESVDALIAAMKLDNEAARKAAATTLAALRTPEAMETLRSAAVGDVSPEVRQICLVALGE